MFIVVQCDQALIVTDVVDAAMLLFKGIFKNID
jgi:hypothetical protein